MIPSLNGLLSRQTANTPTTGIISMAAVPVYELNNAGDDYAGTGQLFDGVLNKQVIFGFGKVEPVDIWMFEVYKTYAPISITKIRLYQYEGSSSSPTIFYGLTDFSATPTVLASFSGGGFETWLEYDINVTGLKYIKMVVGSSIPSQMEVTGTYTELASPTLFAIPAATLSRAIGTNMFEWQIMDGDNNNPDQVLPSKLTAMEAFSQVRHYLDWDKLEHARGLYCFEPASSGGWDYDVMYAALFGAGITILGCIKTQPNWMLIEYPSGSQDSENAPVEWISGAQVSKSVAASYLAYGQVLFQYAGRYGSNTGLDTSLLHPNTQPKQFGQPGFDNVLKVGLGLVTYIEVNNETDRWWKGLLSYQSAYEYGMNLSVCYDGHLNTMGSGVGIKNADPNMQVVMSGTAGTLPDYIRGIVDWSRDNRGYTSGGVVNIPCDVFNFHFYASSSGTSQTGSTDPGTDEGICPELSNAESVVSALLYECALYNKPLFITETGYDEVAGSAIAAFAIGSKSIALVKADWILRTSLLYARLGVTRVFFYEAYDDDPGVNVQFATSGLLNAAAGTLRKPAGDFLFQALNLFAGYTFVSSSINGSGVVTDVYNNGAKNGYVVFSPTQTGVTVSYTLAVSGSVTVYQPLAGSTTMTNLGTSKTFTASETPVFVVLS